MSFRNSGAPARGRPRDATVEERVLMVVLELLGEVGYDAITFEGVARRSGASKATLYRRWSTKRAMVLAALRQGPAGRPGGAQIDTGSLRGDLLALCRRLDTTLRDTDSRTALLLLEAGLEDPELCAAIEAAVGPTGARLPPEVLAAAVRRGELPEGADPFPFEEVVGSVLLLRRSNGLLADDDYLAALVDHIVLPALRCTATAAQALPAGLFSGCPARTPKPEEHP